MSSQLNFWSGKNYMKRDTSTGSTSIAAPLTSAYGGGLFITQFIVTHNLGFIPFFSVFYEPFKDGIVWEVLGNRNQGLAVNPTNTAATGPYCIAWPTTTLLTIEIGYDTNTLTGTYPIYWVIYRDYGIA